MRGHKTFMKLVVININLNDFTFEILCFMCVCSRDICNVCIYNICIISIYLSKFFRNRFLKEQIYSDSIWKVSYVANTLAQELQDNFGFSSFMVSGSSLAPLFYAEAAAGPPPPSNEGLCLDYVELGPCSR